MGGIIKDQHWHNKIGDEPKPWKEMTMWERVKIVTALIVVYALATFPLWRKLIGD